MSINYITLGQQLGSIIKQVNLILGVQAPTLSTGADDIAPNYDTSRLTIDGLQTQFQSFANSAAGWISVLNSYTDATLAGLQQTLNAPSSDSRTILTYLIADMLQNNVALEKSNTIAFVESFIGYGNGSLIVGNVTANDFLTDVDERPKTETVAIRCVQDEYTGTAAGAEIFQINGWPSQNPASYKTQGTGSVGPSLTTIQQDNLLTNSNFESWSETGTDIYFNPIGWDVPSGSDPLDLIEPDTSIYYTGTTSAKLIYNGTGAAYYMSQDVSDVLSVDTVYAFGYNYRASCTGGAAPGLQIKITGTGMSDIVLSLVNPVSITQNVWHTGTYLFTLPKFPPSDLKIEVYVGISGATGHVWIDNMAIAPATDFGHVKYAIHAGSTNFLRGDEFKVDVSNDGNSKFQTYFSRFYDTALPTQSDEITSTTLILDSWAS